MDAKSETKVKSVNRLEDRDPLPETFNSLEELGEFWDTHDSADYEDLMEEVEFEINLPLRETRSYAIAKDLSARLQQIARQQGVSTETLINLWLQEKLAQVTSYQMEQKELALAEKGENYEVARNP